MNPISFERSGVAAAAAIPFAVILAQSLTAVLFHLFDVPEPVPVLSIAYVSGTVILFSALLWPRFRSWKSTLLSAIVLSILGTAARIAFGSYSMYEVIVLLTICPCVSTGGWLLARRLPECIDGSLRRSPIKSIAWILLVLMMIVQLGRLNSRIIDSDNDVVLGFWDPLSEKHSCMSAYVYAADLSRQSVDNIYDRVHYPHMSPDAVVRSTVDGLEAGDPFQYPPQFLMLPYLALTLTNSFDLIRIFWFLIQFSAFVLMAVVLARSVGGQRGSTAIWLIPAALASFPFMAHFQYGQFHLPSIMLGVAGLLLFEKKRPLLGGAALGFAVLSKITPGILLIWLMARRQWKEVGWTAAACIAYTAIALLVVGTQPFIAFFTEHLPNLYSGTATAFNEVWPDLREPWIVWNQSPQTVITRLGRLGVPGMSSTVGEVVQKAYVLAIVGLAIGVGIRSRRGESQTLVGLALLNLACFFGKAASGDYVVVGTIWLLTFLAREMTINIPRMIAYVACWLLVGLALGVFYPEGADLFPTFALFTLAGFILIISFNLWTVLHGGGSTDR